jgi:hypothetical protein
MALPLVRVHLSSVDSTNSWAKRSSAQLAPGSLTVVTATEQTAGRGRGARAWASSGGDDIKVTFAFGLTRAQVATAYLLSPLLSVTARRALAARGVAGCQVKWPNDLLLGGCRKVGGILCELESLQGGGDGGGGGGSAEYLAVLGLGLNVGASGVVEEVEGVAVGGGVREGDWEGVGEAVPVPVNVGVGVTVCVVLWVGVPLGVPSGLLEGVSEGVLLALCDWVAGGVLEGVGERVPLGLCV